MPSQSPSAERKDTARSRTPDHTKRSHDKITSSPTKRKSLAGVADGPTSSTNANTDDSITAEDKENAKKKRRKVNHACVYCRRSHMTCDLQRPCARCVKRDIGHLCHDEIPLGKRNKSDVGVSDLAPAGSDPEQEAAGVPPATASNTGDYSTVRRSVGDIDVRPGAGVASRGGGGGPQIVQPTPVSPTQLQRRPQPLGPNMNSNNASSNFDWNNTNNSAQNQFQDMHHLHPNYMFNNAEITSEYNLLNDFLSTSLLEDGGTYGSDEAQALLSDPLLSTANMEFLSSTLAAGSDQSLQQQQRSQQSAQDASQLKAGEEITRPSSGFPISEQSRNKFYMTAADPAGLSSAEDRLHKLLKAKYDAGMLKPFNYVGGYARLNAYMSKHLSRTGAVRILRQLDRFRPKFREAMQGLSDMQLVLVEMWFERSLMEYDRVFAAMAIPACCWRRTGEIFRGNREMAELIGVKSETLRDGKLAIHEIIAEDSLVSYWEKLGAIAFDQSQKAILTSCVLKRVAKTAERADGEGAATTKNEKPELVKCCFSFTIRRDTHNIPSLIVGNFIPTQPRG